MYRMLALFLSKRHMQHVDSLALNSRAYIKRGHGQLPSKVVVEWVVVVLFRCLVIFVLNLGSACAMLHEYQLPFPYNITGVCKRNMAGRKPCLCHAHAAPTGMCPPQEHTAVEAGVHKSGSMQ